MQFKVLVVNNRNQSNWAMVNSLWLDLEINAEKLITIIDYHQF